MDALGPCRRPWHLKLARRGRLCFALQSCAIGDYLPGSHVDSTQPVSGDLYVGAIGVVLLVHTILRNSGLIS